MRTKCEIKRKKILEVAEKTFRELGFEGASMGEISARVGGSKATLYNYFSSKEELLFEIVFSAIETEFNTTHALLTDTGGDLVSVLIAFGEGLLSSLYTPPSAIEVRRLIFAESRRSDLGKICYERGVQRSHAQLSRFLGEAMQQGKLKKTDPDVAAWHLYGLLDSTLLRRCLLCVQDSVSEEEVRTAVRQAITVFMAGYGAPEGLGLPHSSTETDALPFQAIAMA